MSERIQFDLQTLLGDTVASDFQGIDYLNCFEYTFWQLMRQNGITDYWASLHTTAFLTEPKSFATLHFYKPVMKNLAVVEANLKRMYGVRRIPYEGQPVSGERLQEGSYVSFLQEAIRKGRFVYALYDHFHDTINDPGQARQKNTYHSTLLTGYDDERQMYIALIDGRYNIGYEDFERMYRHFHRRSRWIRPWITFYLTPVRERAVSMEQLRGELALDLEKSLADWKRESEIFATAADEMLGRFQGQSVPLEPERERELYRLRIFFYKMRLGLHGNLYLKLRAFQTITGIWPEAFYQRYLKNRRKSEVIANLIGRVYVDYSYEKLESVAKKMKEVFVDEAAQLREELQGMIDKSW